MVSQLHHGVILNRNVVEVKNLPTHVGETLRFAQGDTTTSRLTQYTSGLVAR